MYDDLLIPGLGTHLSFYDNKFFTEAIYNKKIYIPIVYSFLLIDVFLSLRRFTDCALRSVIEQVKMKFPHINGVYNSTGVDIQFLYVK